MLTLILNSILASICRLAGFIAPRSHEIVERVELPANAEEGSYWVARILMQASHWILDFLHLSHHGSLFIWVYSILVLGVSVGIGWVVQTILVLLLRYVSRHIHSDISEGLLKVHFFSKTSRIIPAIVFLILIQFTLYQRQSLSMWLTHLTWIYIIYVIARSLSMIADVVWLHVDSRENKRRLPLRGIVQLIKGIIWAVAAIIIIAILVNKSPGALLAGLGAFAAVLMLIFKDSILGLVAGVQLSENDSLHVGDWIKVSGTDANGTVVEVSLTQVKVMNFDKTITTIPPYNLVSGSFTNYRNMQRSDTRRIARNYMIDADAVVACDDKMLDDFAEIPLMKEWIAKKRQQKAAGKSEDAGNSEGLVDGSIETNLGVFRAYVQLYLNAHPRVSHASGDTCFVTTLPQTSTGIPLQVYCFTNTSAWLEYEAIMASIFEHLAVMLYRFKLYTFEYATGRDSQIEGYLSPGKSPDSVFGLCQPFFNSPGSENPSVSQNSSPVK